VSTATVLIRPVMRHRHLWIEHPIQFVMGHRHPWTWLHRRFTDFLRPTGQFGCKNEPIWVLSSQNFPCELGLTTFTSVTRHTLWTYGRIGTVLCTLWKYIQLNNDSADIEEVPATLGEARRQREAGIRNSTGWQRLRLRTGTRRQWYTGKGPRRTPGTSATNRFVQPLSSEKNKKSLTQIPVSP
jgi:hypothetical protein